METMIVARFFRTADLILQTENDGGRVGNGKWFHSSMKPQIHHYAQLLMSQCLVSGTFQWDVPSVSEFLCPGLDCPAQAKSGLEWATPKRRLEWATRPLW